jgi:nucleotide-binding universal stress UspA family protein
MALGGKLVVPVDGSPHSLRALRYAGKRQLAMQQGRILVLNVQSPLPASRFVSRAMIDEHQSREGEAALKPARELIKRMKLDADIHVRTGEPAAVITDFAKQVRCGEIVMGTRGLGRVAGLVLGSVATKVLVLAPCPVTLVK